MERHRKKVMQAKFTELDNLTELQPIKRPLKENNNLWSPIRTRNSVKRQRCSSGPMDRFVAQKRPGHDRNAVKSSEYAWQDQNQGQFSTDIATEKRSCSPEICDRIEDHCASASLDSVAKQPMFQTKAKIATKKFVTASNNGVFKGRQNNKIKISGPILERAFAEFASFKTALDLVEQFDLTKTEVKKAQPLSPSLTSICECYMEPGMHSILIHNLWRLVNAQSYPQPQTLAFVLWEVLLGGTSSAIVRDAYCFLKSVLARHPPTSSHMQLYYRQVLCFCDGISGLCDLSGKKNLMKVLDFAACKHQSRGQSQCSVKLCRTNRILTIDYIASLFETDFSNINRKWDQLVNGSSGVAPLFALMLWRNKSMDYVNETIQDLIRSTILLLTNPSSEPEAQHCCLRLLAIAASCCRWADRRDAVKDADTLLPGIGLIANSFAWHVCSEIAAKELNYHSLHNLLKKLYPSWLRLKVSQFLLERMVKREKSFFSGFDRPLPLRTLCTDYFRSVFGFDPSGSLIRNVAKKSLVVNVDPLALREVRNENMMKEMQLPPNNALVNWGLPSAVCSAPVCTSSSIIGSTMRQRGIDELKKINRRNPKGETPLHCACMKNDVARVRQLLSVPGILVNARDNAGWTPLHEACCHGNVECVSELLAYRPRNITGRNSSFVVDVEVRGPDGITPIIDAICHNHHAVVHLLLSHKGPTLLRAVTEYGKTAFDLVRDEDMRILLESYCHDKCEDASSTGNSLSLVTSRSYTSISSSQLHANFTVLYHAITSYLVFHQPCHLCVIISNLMKAVPSPSCNNGSKHSIDKTVANNLAEDLSQLYKMQKRLSRVRSCFGKVEENAPIISLLDELVLLSLSNKALLT